MESENEEEIITTSPQEKTMMLTKTRQYVTPYLPPPVVKTIHAIDSNPVFTSYTTEPSMAILVSTLLCFVVWNVLKIIGAVVGGGKSTLHLDDADDVLADTLATAKNRGKDGSGSGGSDKEEIFYDDTVVLCGSTGSGKTALLYQMCGSNGGLVPTVMSMKATVGYIKSSSATVRIIDYPGHPSLSSQLPTALTSSSKKKQNPTRIIFTVDSTKPVADGAELLYSILTNATVRSFWENMVSKNNDTSKIPIVIVCTKQDVKNAKNWKRMKIQLRTELDKIRKVVLKSTKNNKSKDVNEGGGGEEILTLGVPGKTLDFEKLGEDIPVSIHFTSVSCVTGDGMDNLKEFVTSGVIVD